MMTYKELINLINEEKFFEVFEILNEVYDHMPDRDKPTYNQLKKVFEKGKEGVNYDQRLKVFVSGIKNVLSEIETSTTGTNSLATLEHAKLTSQKLKALTQGRFSRSCQRKLDFANKKFDNLEEELEILHKNWTSEMDDVRKKKFERRIDDKEKELKDIDEEIQQIEKECEGE